MPSYKRYKYKIDIVWEGFLFKYNTGFVDNKNIYKMCFYIVTTYFSYSLYYRTCANI